MKIVVSTAVLPIIGAQSSTGAPTGWSEAALIAKTTAPATANSAPASSSLLVRRAAETRRRGGGGRRGERARGVAAGPVCHAAAQRRVALIACLSPRRSHRASSAGGRQP